MRTLFALVAFAVMGSVCWGQGTPGGTYRAPGQLESWSYTAEPKARFIVEVKAPVQGFDAQGKPQESIKTIGKYAIMGSQWPGLRKNIEKFCKDNKMVVTKVNMEGSPKQIYLIPIPPAAKDLPTNDPNYAKQR